jgi:dCTP deaminase
MDAAAHAAFWSGETLRERLPNLICPYNDSQVDCAAYTLAIGREIYVSPNDQIADPSGVTIRKLNTSDAFTIPPGQFAFLLTEEIIEVPGNAIAFISIKAKIKWRGLINVSGFHADPGFRGRLVFAVFNAGPVPVHLRQGQPMFLIWYANLDRQSTLIKQAPVQESIPPELIMGISGELQSFSGLSKKMKDLETSLTVKVHAIEREQTYYRVLAVIALGVIVAIAVPWIKTSVSYLFAASSPPPVASTIQGRSAGEVLPAPAAPAPTPSAPSAPLRGPE